MSMNGWKPHFDKVVEAFRAEGYPHDVIGQWTLPEYDVRDLLETVRDHQPQKILEVGTFVGLSTMLMALAGRQDAMVTSVDPNFPLEVEMGSMGSKMGESDGKRRTHDIARAVSRRLDIEERIELVAGGFSSGASFASRRLDPALAIPIVGPDVCAAHGPFDMIFIDGLHYADVVESDLELASQHLAPGGVVLMHDCIGMWGTNVRCGILRFLAGHSEWKFLHPPFQSLYRSIGTVFRATERPELAKELLQSPKVDPVTASRLQPLASSLIERLQPRRIIELAEGKAKLAGPFSAFVTTNVVQVSENSTATELEAHIRQAFMDGIKPTSLLVTSVGVPDILDDRSFSGVLEVISRTGVVGAFLRTPPGERGTTCSHSRPLRQWVALAARAEVDIRVGHSFDLAPSTFHFIRRQLGTTNSTALTGLVLATPQKSYEDDPRVGGLPVLSETHADEHEQQEVLQLHYGVAFQRMFTDADGATQTIDQLQQLAQKHEQAIFDRTQATEQLREELDAWRNTAIAQYAQVRTQQQIIEWQARLLRNEPVSERWRKLIRTSRSFHKKILDTDWEIVIEDALAHAARHSLPGPCLMLSWTPSEQELDVLLADISVGAVGVKDTPDTLLPPHQSDDPRVGRYFHGGTWMLPDGVQTVYFVGPWRLVTRSMLAEAWRAGVKDLYTRAGAYWLRIPMERLYGIYLRNRKFQDRIDGYASQLARSFKQAGLYQALPKRLRTRVLTFDEAFGLAIEGVAPKEDFVPGRVVLVCGNLSPGGAERQVANTLIGLKQRGVEDVHLLAHHLQPGRHQYNFHLGRVRAAGVSAHEIERAHTSPSDPEIPQSLRKASPGLPSDLLLDIANLAREFDRLKPEVVHAWLDWDNIRAGFAAAICGVPRILLSGRNLAPYNFNLHQSYMKAGYRLLATLPNVQFLNNSRAGGDNYADWIGISRDRIKIIYNGFSPGDGDTLNADERRRQRHEIGVGDNDFLVGGIFRFEDEKRPLLWLDCAAKIASALPNARFVLYGQGSMRAAMEARIAKPDLEGRATLAGTTKTPLEAMSLMDIFLLTSHGEGLPNVLIEAQSVGTPVVSTRVGGAPEAIDLDVAGKVVDSADPDQLAFAVIEFLQNPDARLRAKTAGPRFVRSKFGYERMIEETIAAYAFTDLDEESRHAKKAS
jgi:glycosyltransferase involved in cell wall biosynthesis/predicted O-methyltransferase YrrM